MSLLHIQQGALSYGSDQVFSGLNFELNAGEKIAIVGRNGCGKTSLLKVLSGELSLDHGQRSVSKLQRIGTLAQYAFDNPGQSVQDSLLALFKDLRELEQQLQTMEEQLAHREDLLEPYAKLRENFERLGGYRYSHEMMRIFTQFGFSEADLDQPINSFSGGQQTRLAMVHLLLSQPDILLLDEPTNHLDVETIQWLESYLKAYPKAIVFVSHDRTFIDQIADAILEMHDGQLTRYPGSYEQYVSLKALALEKQHSAYQRQQKDIERLEGLIEKFRYKKNKAKFAQSKIKYLERMELIEAPKSQAKQVGLRFRSKVKGSKHVLQVDQLQVGYQQPLLTTSFSLDRGEHLALVGPNGHGKSTLLKTLLGMIPALGGDYLMGHHIQLGYFDQQQIEIQGKDTLLEYLTRRFSDLNTTQIRTLLGTFLFTQDDVFKRLDVLSGGERVRLIFAKLMLEGANLLLLDEPTNHLDIESKEALEKALLAFDGTLIFATHDRTFIRKLAKKVLTIGYGQATLSEQAQSLTPQPALEPIKPKAEPVIRARITPSRILRQIKQVEQLITDQEEALQTKRALRFEPEYYHDFQKMQQLDEEIDEIHNAIAGLMKDWESLNESLVLASQDSSDAL